MAATHRTELLGIAIRLPASREIRELSSAKIDTETGLEGDKRNRPGRRQVTLMSLAAWHQACGELGVELPWTTRRANLLVDALPLYQTTGARLRLGDVLLEVTGETDPCSKMDAAHAGLFAALLPDWRGGVTCRVVQGGELLLGQTVELHLPDQEGVV